MLLAAGESRRLQSPAGETKLLLEVGGCPVLGWALRSLVDLAPDRIVIVVGRHRSPIVAFAGDSVRGISIRYAEQSVATGPAEGLLAAEPHVTGSGPFAVINGDNIFAADLTSAVRDHEGSGADATLLVERVSPEEAEQGICRVTRDGRVSEIVEAPTAEDRQIGVVSAGFYLFRNSIFEACRRAEASAADETKIPDAVNLMIEDGMDVRVAWLEGGRVNVNRPEDLARAERLLAARGLDTPKRPCTGPERSGAPCRPPRPT